MKRGRGYVDQDDGLWAAGLGCRDVVFGEYHVSVPG